MRIDGNRAWTALIVAAGAYELVATDGELLSEAFDRFRSRHPFAANAAVLLTAGHLLRVLPQRLDPYSGLGLVGRPKFLRPWP